MGVFLLNKNGETQAVFSLNEKGPIVYVKSLYEKIYIEDKIFNIDYTEESQVKGDYQILNESEKIQFKTKELNNLSDQLVIKGHLDNIGIKSFIEELEVP